MYKILLFWYAFLGPVDVYVFNNNYIVQFCIINLKWP